MAKKNKQQYAVSGLAPAINAQVNQLMNACGLGGDGAFIVKGEIVTLTIKKGDTDSVAYALKDAYELAGWIHVTVTKVSVFADSWSDHL